MFVCCIPNVLKLVLIDPVTETEKALYVSQGKTDANVVSSVNFY